jgi:SulP family sulfate permease
LLAVFLLTVMVDLTVAVEFGLFAACVTFIYRISNLSRIEALTSKDTPKLAQQEGQISAYRLYGALFFGAVKLVEAIEDKLPEKTLVLDLKNLIYIDSSGADALMALARICHKKQVRLIVCGLSHQPLDIARRTGFLELVGQNVLQDYESGLDTALLSVKQA